MKACKIVHSCIEGRHGFAGEATRFHQSQTHKRTLADVQAFSKDRFLNKMSPLPRKRRKNSDCLFSDSDMSDASTADGTVKDVDHAAKRRQGAKDVSNKGSCSQRGKTKGAFSEVLIESIDAVIQLALFSVFLCILRSCMQ